MIGKRSRATAIDGLSRGTVQRIEIAIDAGMQADGAVAAKPSVAEASAQLENASAYS
jgi:hypothetical protein